MDALAGLPIGTLLASFFVFQLLFHFLSSWFSAAVSPGFKSLSFEKKIEWNSRVVSTFHSLVVGILGLYIFFFDEVTAADPFWGSSSISRVNIAIASGYLVSDLLALLLYWKVIGDKYFVIHHCSALLAFYIVLRDGVLEYIGNVRLLSELSSPFVNQRESGVSVGDSVGTACSLGVQIMAFLDARNSEWFLETLKYPKFSRANVANGVLMTAVFFLVRIAAIPPLYHFLCSAVGTEPFVRLGPVTQVIWVVTSFVLDAMNVMWMVKISRGCLKVLSLLRDEKARGGLQNGKLA